MIERVRLESRIDRVAVFRSGALVTRVATIAPSDRQDREVEIGPLPLSIDDGSIRMALRGEQTNAIASEVRVALRVPSFDPSLAPLRPDEIERAEREIAAIRVRLEQCDRERARFESIGSIGRPAARPGRTPPPSPADERLALLDLRARELDRLFSEREALARTLREAERNLADLRARDARASSARRPEPNELRKSAIAVVRGSIAREVELELTYRVDAARWAPTYVLRLDRQNERGALEVRACVSQRTGEDWEDVMLTLSTAELRGWAELPELAAIRIGRKQPHVAKKGWRPPPQDTEALFADFDRAQAQIAPPVRTPAPRRAEVYTREGEMPPMPVPPPSAIGYGAPPMQSFAAPAPMAPMPAAPAGAPMPARHAPMPQARSMSMLKAKGLFGGGAEQEAPEALLELSLSDDALGAAPEEPSPEPAVSGAMLDYGSMQMPPPNASARGKLAPRPPRETYAALLAEHDLQIDLTRVFAAIEDAARAVRERPLPNGCAMPIPPSGFDYVYRAQARLSAPSDGTFHNLALRSDEGRVRAHFVIVPRESRDAFRFVEMDNPLDAPLLGGPIDVYMGESFLATSAVREVGPHGVLRLGLGVDPRIKVSRNARFKEKSGGLIGGRLDLAHEIEIEIESHLEREVELEVRERIPVTREGEDEVEVREGAIEPAWEAWEPKDDDSLRGGRRWNVKLAPAKKCVLVARYEVRIASKHELAGGNRRET
jgi:hypothetical protein